MTRRKLLEFFSIFFVQKQSSTYKGDALVIASDHEIDGEIAWIELRFKDGTAVSIGGTKKVELMNWLISRRGSRIFLAIA